MDMLLTFLLPGALFLALELTWCRAAARHRLSPARRDEAHASRLAPETDPYAWSFVQHRLDVLAAELEDLENDQEIFAKAFRTQVATSAYKALMADATRLADASRLAALSPLSDTTVVEMQISSATASHQEELVV